MRKLVPWQRQFLGLKAFPDQFGGLELPFYFTFSSDEIKHIVKRYQAEHQIPVALQMGFLRMTGCFLKKAPKTLPTGLLQH